MDFCETFIDSRVRNISRTSSFDGKNCFPHYAWLLLRLKFTTAKLREINNSSLRFLSTTLEMSNEENFLNNKICFTINLGEKEEK